jgi:two-component system LytT family response regulator
MTESLSLRVLIVDDERYARERLIDLLDGRKAVAAIDTADSGEAAIRALREGTYDLVFLDVQMPGRTGLDVVDVIGPTAMPTTVFVTAYDQYAIQAFEHSALDYLLKPFDDDRFEQAVERAVKMHRLQEADAVTQQFQRLLETTETAEANATETGEDEPEDETDAQQPAPYVERLTIDLPGQVRVVPVKDIRYVSAEDTYVKIHTEDDTYLLRERMHVLEDRLNPRQFARIHRSTIVRLDLIETVLHRSGGDYAVRLSDRTELDVSRSRRDKLLERLETGAS